jgi:serine/threonine protein kinase
MVLTRIINANSIVMEFADNGDLFQKITEHQKNNTCFTESEIWNVFIQVVKGLRALHDLKILHRDMKVRRLRKRCRVRMFSFSKTQRLNLAISMSAKLLKKGWDIRRLEHHIMQVQKFGGISHMILSLTFGLLDACYTK